MNNDHYTQCRHCGNLLGSPGSTVVETIDVTHEHPGSQFQCFRPGDVRCAHCGNVLEVAA